MGKVVGLAFTSALNPSLVTATTVMLLLPRPERLMLGYWVGALLTSVTLGLVIVFTLEGSGFKFNNPQVKSTCGCGSSFSV